MDRELTSTERSQHQLRRWWRPIVIVVIATVVLIWLASWLRPSVALSQVRVAEVTRGDLEAVVSATGTAQPAAERVVTSPVAARVLTVLREPGGQVTAGDPILELDVSATQLSLDQVNGRVEQKQAERRERRLALDREVTDLRSERRIKELELEEARFQLEQENRLFNEGLLAISGLRATQTRVKRLEIELETLGTRVDQSEQAAVAQLEGLDAELESLGQERAQFERLLTRATTRAEHDGVLTWVLDEVGATVDQGEVLARLADLDSFRVEASASAVHAERVATGLPVRLRLGDEPLTGRVSQVYPEVEEGTLRFGVALDRPDHPGLRANLRIEVLVVTARRDEVSILAKGPFANGPGEHEVFVIAADGKRATRRRVTLGLSGERHWEVVDGLEAGERVIVSDTSRFRQVEELRIR
ncbi:MAG: HlyD family efflux transporter periplasmic adaptor subunit [Acidobacteriota bacterium]